MSNKNSKIKYFEIWFELYINKKTIVSNNNRKIHSLYIYDFIQKILSFFRDFLPIKGEIRCLKRGSF